MINNTTKFTRADLGTFDMSSKEGEELTLVNSDTNIRNEPISKEEEIADLKKRLAELEGK